MKTLTEGNTDFFKFKVSQSFQKYYSRSKKNLRLMTLKKVLLTGGTGYIASNTAARMIENGAYEPILLDNLHNSYQSTLNQLENVTKNKISFYKGDVCEEKVYDTVFKEHDIHAVIHLAGLKSVDESLEDPLSYYQVNVGGTVALLKKMKENDIKNLVFSSSAAVYGQPKELPIKVTTPCDPVNPYGQSKLMAEKVIQDFSKSWPGFNYSILRYFNPYGCHNSGKLKSNPKSPVGNIYSELERVASGEKEHFTIYGNDYPTRDGTCVRDYIHISDLSQKHLDALEKMKKISGTREIRNIGTGKGVTVLEFVKMFEESEKVNIKQFIENRRRGDVVESYLESCNYV